MAPVSWVAGTGAGYVSSGTSISSPNTPAGIQDNDGLFAFVHTLDNTTVTPPAGWTAVTTAGAAAGSYYVKLHVFQKDTVTSGNSSTSYSFSVASSTQLSLAYACVRASAGSIRVEDVVTQALANQSTYDVVITFPTTSAARNGSMFLLVDGTAWTVGGSTSPTLSSFTGATQWTGNQNLNLMAGVYWPRNAGQTPGSANTTRYTGSVIDNGEVSIVLNISAPVIEETLTEGTTFDSHSGEGDYFGDTLTDGVGAAPVLGVARAVPISDTVRAVESATALRRVAPLAEDTVTGGDTTTYSYRPAAAVLEALRLVETTGVTYTGGITLVDTARVAELLSSAIGDSLADGAIFFDQAAAVQSILVLQGIGAGSVLEANSRLTRTIAETLALHPSLAQFFSGVIDETLEIAGSLAASQRMPTTVAEGLGLAELMGHSVVLKVALADDMELTHEQVLLSIFSPTVLEGVEIGAAYIQPNGSVTTWAVNTRTNATTEYQNYDFRSFARMGRRYIAASSTGLYELDGDDDAGTDIIARLRTGLAQFAGSRFSSLKAVYLGLRGDGEFLLKIVEADGTERGYKVLVDSSRTAKVQTGKGLRSRYFAFELVTTGQDFDLDAIEMVPILNQRRV